jgi:fluoride ion exporter CrcB/FEX
MVRQSMMSCVSVASRRVVVAPLCLVMAICITGCGSGAMTSTGSIDTPPGGGSGGSGGSGGGSSSGQPSDTTEYIYVGAQPYLLEYQFDTKTGTATWIQSLPIASPSYSRTAELVANTSANYLYDSEFDFTGIDGYSISANGALTPVQGSPFNTPPSPSSSAALGIALTPDGSTLYVAQNTPDLIAGFQIDSSTGQLTPLSGNVAFGQNASLGQFEISSGDLIVDPTGSFVYAALDTTGITDSAGNPYPGIAAFSIDPKTRNLTELANSPFILQSGSAPLLWLTIDPTGQFVYVAFGNSGGIAGFSRDATTGNLTSIEGSPFPTATASANYILMHPSGKFLFASTSDAQSNISISTYSINGATGALSLFATGAQNTCPLLEPAAIDPTGSYLVGGAISICPIDQTSGAVGSATVLPYSGPQLNWSPTSLAIVPAQ